MAVFVIDEDMPRSTGRMLSAIGHQVKDIRDHGLRGADDDRVFRFAQDNQAVLLTADLGFGNPLRFARHRHFGIVIARFPNEMTMVRTPRPKRSGASAMSFRSSSKRLAIRT